jgi:hypothetical protein
MKFRDFFKFTSLVLLQSTSQASIQKVKVCRNCKFFRSNTRECGYFGSTDLVTGKIIYEYASSMRNDKNKCGEIARHFEENKYKIVSVPYYFFLDYWYIFFAFGASIGFNIIAILYNVQN